MNLAVTAKLYKSLKSFLVDLPGKFDELFNEAIKLFEDISSHRVETIRTRSAANQNNPEDDKENFKKHFLLIIKSLIDNLEPRSTAYIELDERFSFLIGLNKLSDLEISESCKKIASIYDKDVCEAELIEECHIAKGYFDFSQEQISHAIMYSTIIKDGILCTMPNIEIVLRIFLCLFCTNVYDERTFSKMKYIKNYLRNTMGEEKLNAFALLSIENVILKKLNFDEIIDEFILAKNRRKTISTTSSVL